jgi:hypothetical protein
MVTMKNSTFWDITPYSSMKVNLRFGGSKQTLKMEAIYSSEICVDFHRTIRCYIPKSRTLILNQSMTASFYGLCN